MLSLLIAGSIQTSLVIPNPHVLVFSKTTGFRHDSIPNAIAAIKKLGTEHDFKVDATEDATVFNDENLKKYDLICFASTTGTILDANQKKAMERFVESGKGWMGIHSASDTEYDWPWYADLVGAYFKSHPPGGQRVHVKIENRGNPSTNGLPNLWIRPDEWYDWQANPRSKVQVLASIDESYYRPENPQDHPIAWCHWKGKGRAWYTEMGHFKEAYSEPIYVSHLYGGLMWAAQGSRRPDGAEDLNSSKSYENSQFHTEFKVAKDGRSSISFDSNAKVHLADSSAKARGRLAETDCGGVTGNSPMTNAFAGTENWNVLDVVFEGKGSKFVEVRLNGVVVQKNVTVDGVAPMRRRITLGTGPVQYRNTWIKGLNK